MARAKTLITIGALILAFFIISVLGSGAQITSAAASSYSDPLVDLRAGGKINVDDFPVITGDYSLSVIQIAESTDKELLIYVYQPAADTSVKATTLRFSTSKNNTEGAQWLDYGLEFLNSNGAYFKYRVKDFEVSDGETRFYNLAAIHRRYISGTDPEPTDDNTVNETVYAIGELWIARTVDGQVNYVREVSDVVEIRPEQKHIGMLRYRSGWLPFLGSAKKCDSHYVAFDCDYKIEQLYGAAVTYVQQEYAKVQSLTEHINAVGDPVAVYKFMNGESTGNVNVTGALAEAYEWKRIQTVNEFLNDPINSELTDEAKDAIKDKQWVLRFAETDYEIFTIFGGGTQTNYYEVSFVSILQLNFKTAGKSYNLGVVDNKQKGSGTPENPPAPGTKGGCAASWAWLNVLPWWAWLLIFPAGIVVLILLCKFVIPLPFRKLSEHIERKSKERARRRAKKQGAKKK